MGTMRMSPQELDALLEKNPQLRIQAAGVNTDKKAKYRNKKQYEYEDGAVLEQKDQKRHGKVVAIYDSKKEYLRWRALLLLERAGEISGLRRQVTLTIQEKFEYRGERIRAITYRADFLYRQKEETVVEDVKTYDKKKGKYLCTDAFQLKWKLLMHRYPAYKFMLY